ncbi:hypothetical protein RUM43_000100 [Polyplax serrata]|uniref:G-protein coupled receptors family 2 profile 1 domain-containing protein n=1 Tax=Polyplax serrata TaxID=468196 RepID=A0AAN8SF07_POLSC
MISFQGVALSAEELESILQIERIKCDKLAERESKGNGTCKTIWDGILCWPSAYSNQVLTQQCPSYIAGFDHLLTLNQVKSFIHYYRAYEVILSRPEEDI